MPPEPRLAAVKNRDDETAILEIKREIEGKKEVSETNSPILLLCIVIPTILEDGNSTQCLEVFRRRKSK